MIRISVSGQSTDSGPIAFVDLYNDRTREALRKLYRHTTIEDGRLRIDGDLLSRMGTAHTKAIIGFRLGDGRIKYEVQGVMRPGRRTWCGIGVAILLLICEAYLRPQSTEVMLASAIAQFLGLASTLYYLTTFYLFASLARRRLLAVLQEVCTELRPHA